MMSDMLELQQTILELILHRYTSEEIYANQSTGTTAVCFHNIAKMLNDIELLMKTSSNSHIDEHLR